MSSPTERARERVLLVVFLTVFLDLIGFGIVIPLLPLYVETMGGDAETVGILFACFSLTQLMATPWLGRLSDRYGRRRVVLLSLAGNSLAMGVFALATKLSLLPILFASRILAGATSGNLSTCQAAIADVTSGPDRARGMGRLGAGIGLGMVLGPFLGGAVSSIGPWAPPLLAAVLALADLVAAAFLMPETRHLREPSTAAPPDRPPPTLRATLAEPAMVKVLALYFLLFLGLTNMQVVLSLVARSRFAWTEREVGLAFGLYGLIMFVVQGALIGRLAKRFGAVNLLVASALFLAVGMATLGLAPHSAVLLLGQNLAAVGMGLAGPLLSTLASELAPDGQQGAVLGFAQSAGGLGRTVGPLWSGMLYARVGSSAPFFAAALTSLISATVGLRLRAAAAASPTSTRSA
jgi:MFS transporter, DHA1 family, tetracycline resistance protein